MTYSSQTIHGQRISSLRIAQYQCPSEINDRGRDDASGPLHWPLNYAVNLGTWFVWDPATGEGGAGAFYPNSRLQPGSIRDGLSKTVCAAEVKAYTPYERNAGLSGPLPFPLVPDDLPDAPEKKFSPPTGHTEWVDGRAHQAGFTATFTPNSTVSPSHASGLDIDWNNQQEGKSPTIRTYAAVTSRSYHPSVVNIVMLDGSTQSISQGVDRPIWQAAATRAGQEVLAPLSD